MLVNQQQKKLMKKRINSLSYSITLNKPNAREALDAILKQINAEVRMITFSIVSADFINVKNNSIDISEYIIYKGRHLINQYADRLDIFIENAISEDDLNKQAIIYPGAEAWASVRGTASFLTSDEFIMEVPYPIQEVLKWEIYAEAKFTSGAVPNIPITIKQDITELLLEKPAYEALEYDLSDPLTAPVRNNSVYYEKGGTRILGFHEKLDLFSLGGAIFTYEHLLRYAIEKQSAPNPSSASLDNYEEFMFRLTYVSRQGERLRIEKAIPLGNRTLFINQAERIPDIEKLGNKMREDVEGIGNKQLIIGKRVCSHANASL